jgi:regulator of sigma E protease
MLVSLSVLICLHELGHLLAAKAFNVYCAEYSLGMGPLLFKIKKPNQETQFSVRVLPIGGYVAMAGEGAEDLEEFKDVAPERFLNRKPKWQRAIIMVAGVTVNFILAWVLFIISGFTSPILDTTKRSFIVSESTSETTYLPYENGLRSDDVITNVKFVITASGLETINLEKDINDGRDLYYAVYMFSINSNVFGDDVDYTTSNYVNPEDSDAKWTWTLTTEDNDVISFTLSTSQTTTTTSDGTKVPVNYWNLDSLGLNFNTRNRNFSEAMSRAGQEFVQTFTAFGSLFQKGGWQNLGGIISVYSASSYASSVGFYYYAFLWGYISLNLAVVNILPFPGLDGWHLLVICIEAITKKEVPQKLKSIMSTIGLVLLFGLMIFVTVMDIIRLVV